MAWTKKIKKTAGKVSTAAKKRYGIGKGRGGFKFTQVAKDLEMIKSRLNVEKKFLNTLNIEASVGQVDGNSPGYAYMDLTPVITQGVQESGRVGNSIRATGMVLNVAMRGQINAHKRKLKFVLIRVKDGDVASSLGDVFDVNPLTGLIDYYSERNYSGRVGPSNIVATKYATVIPHNDSSTGFACAKFAFKLNDIIRWNNNADTIPQDFRYSLIVFSDFGNRSLSTASTNPGVLEQGSGTGVSLRMSSRMWYVDN